MCRIPDRIVVSGAIPRYVGRAKKYDALHLQSVSATFSTVLGMRNPICMVDKNFEIAFSSFFFVCVCVSWFAPTAPSTHENGQVLQEKKVIVCEE